MTTSDVWEVAVEASSPQAYEEAAQRLISSGTGWGLEGTVGRGLMDLIENGVCVLGADSHRDFWGSRIPSRTDVKRGTFGSITYANRLRRERGDQLLTERLVRQIEGEDR